MGLLGILKAGGAYVPLDPQYPAERLAVLIEDTLLPVVVGQERWLTELPVSAWTQLVALDTAGPLDRRPERGAAGHSRSARRAWPT